MAWWEEEEDSGKEARSGRRALSSMPQEEPGDKASGPYHRSLLTGQIQ